MRQQTPTLVTAVGSLAVFIALAYSVTTNQTTAFDSIIRQSIHFFATPPLTQLMLAATFVGRIGFMAILAIPFVWYLFRTRRRLDALWLIAIPLTADLLLQILKYTFHRARPEPFFGLPEPGNYSFPSGHALLSTVFYLTLAILMTRRPSIRIAAAALALLIGLSRIYLGVHYPTDVLAGFAAGTFWVSACQLLCNRLILRT
jgi:undecaprenyl-diphosphatase